MGHSEAHCSFVSSHQHLGHSVPSILVEKEMVQDAPKMHVDGHIKCRMASPMFPIRSCLYKGCIVASLGLGLNLDPVTLRLKARVVATVIFMEFYETLTPVDSSKMMIVEMTRGLLYGLLNSKWQNLLTCKRHMALKRNERGFLIISTLALSCRIPIPRYFLPLQTTC